MTLIPHWSVLMSVKDPLLDAQHIELLEMCRSIRFTLEHGHSQDWAFRQRLNELAFLLREHDDAEACVLQQRGQKLAQDLCIQRASALHDIEKLASNFQPKKFDTAVMQHTVCRWIQYHF